MKKLIAMKENEFAKKLLEMKTGDTIEFATNAIWDDKDECWCDGECWYFARKIYIPGYESRFILLDYCGGEEAFAIPMNCNRDEPDLDDVPIVEEYVRRFWGECRGDIYGQVYVEVKS